MNIQIILTNYLLQFMYGERAFQDPLLLSREVIKKAYTDGLYFISSEKVIDRILKSSKLPSSMFLFAGIPTVEEIALTHTIKDSLCALKIHIPYELLADFTISKSLEDTSLGCTFLDSKELEMEKVFLSLELDSNNPIYIESNKDKKSSFSGIEQIEMIKYFSKRLEQYSFAIKRKLDYLKEEWNQFLSSEDSITYLEDENNLQFVKDCYEEIIYEDNTQKL